MCEEEGDEEEEEEEDTVEGEDVVPDLPVSERTARTLEKGGKIAESSKEGIRELSNFYLRTLDV